MEYILVYLLSGFIGWNIENIYNKNKTTICDDTINNKYLHICAPFLNLWGVGGVILLLISKQFSKIDILILSIMTGIFLTLIEGIAGLLSYKINGIRTWNYDKNFYPMLCGYIALDILVYWIMLSFVFILSYRKIKSL